MADVLFREYDIRGKVGSELKIDQVYAIARAIALYCIEQDPSVKRVAVGMDGRTHSPIIKNELCRGLIESGLDVVFIGMCTTPVVYFSLYELDVQVGIMITASHNPKEYNGIKIDLKGKALWGTAIATIGDYYQTNKHIRADTLGSMTEYPLIPRYIASLKKQFPHLIGMHMTVIVDCGNGAGGTIMPDLIKAMEWRHCQLLYAEVDGNYPNHQPDPSSAKNMVDLRSALMKSDARIGIGLDGDCDRMGVMSKAGWLVPADHLLALFVRHEIMRYPGMGIVFDINASDGLADLITQWGAKPYLSPCGAAIIKKVMAEKQAILGGELSCHFFFADRHPGYDDGIYAMMRFFEIVSTNTKSLESMLSFFPKKYSSPVIRIGCSDQNKAGIIAFIKKYFQNRPHDKLIIVDGVRVHMPYGWALIRASNTQPMLSMRFESATQDGLQHIQDDVIDGLKIVMDVTELQTKLEDKG